MSGHTHIHTYILIHTHIHTHRTTTVTLAAHACRGLIKHPHTQYNNIYDVFAVKPRHLQTRESHVQEWPSFHLGLHRYAKA